MSEQMENAADESAQETPQKSVDPDRLAEWLGRIERALGLDRAGEATRHTVIAALLLAGFALIGTALVAMTNWATEDRIAENERTALLHSLHQLIPAEQMDNDLYHDVLMVQDEELLGSAQPVPAYRARKGGEPVAVVLAPVAPDGYGGSIRLLVGIYRNGALAGVRVTSHKETPGLGDAIDAERSDWILGFAGKSLSDPNERGWAVKKDGGVFDQFTGATITPRAVVAAVQRALYFYRERRDSLFAPLPVEE
jgi:electron transport complex protein RnfG